MKHITHFLGVENQDPFKEDHICWVNCDPVFQPINTDTEFSHKGNGGQRISQQDLIDILPAYLEWVTKSYVGTSTTFPSTMSFKVLYINSLSNASAKQTETGFDNAECITIMNKRATMIQYELISDDEKIHTFLN